MTLAIPYFLVKERFYFHLIHLIIEHSIWQIQSHTQEPKDKYDSTTFPLPLGIIANHNYLKAKKICDALNVFTFSLSLSLSLSFSLFNEIQFSRYRDCYCFEPECWSLEEASTIPVVYSTAMYGLVMRGQLREGESVLIHSGAGGVGLAALNICISKKCTIYTTVGSAEKKEFLLREFPSLPKENIFYSRDTSFEEDLMKATGGRGVDIVLNSLSGALLQASLRCVARNGRFIEIGKADLIADIN